MKTHLTILFFYCAAAIQAQTLSPQVISTAGGYATGTSMSLSYTLGELSVQTLESGNLVLTEGFQQPLDIGTFNPERPYFDLEVRTWPNPVSQNLYLQISSDIRQDLILETYDLSGRIRMIHHIEATLHTEAYSVDFSDLARGAYIIKIRSADHSLQRIVKIQKH